MLGSGQATVTATTWDTGGPTAIFDHLPSTLYRTPNIDPAIVTLSFTTPQTLAGSRIMFGGGADHRWQMEVADSLADLDSKSGSYELLVPLTNSASWVFSNASFGAVSKSHVRLTTERLTGDDFVHIHSWDLFCPAAADTAAPAAAMFTGPAAMAGDEATTFTVRYTDDVSVDFRTINFGDLRITGPNGFTQTAGFYEPRCERRRGGAGCNVLRLRARRGLGRLGHRHVLHRTAAAAGVRYVGQAGGALAARELRVESAAA